MSGLLSFTNPAEMKGCWLIHSLPTNTSPVNNMSSIVRQPIWLSVTRCHLEIAKLFINIVSLKAKKKHHLTPTFSNRYPWGRHTVCTSPENCSIKIRQTFTCCRPHTQKDEMFGKSNKRRELYSVNTDNKLSYRSGTNRQRFQQPK